MPRRIFKSLLAAATVASLASGTATVATAQATTNTTAAAQDLSSTHTPTLSLKTLALIPALLWRVIPRTTTPFSSSDTSRRLA